VKTVPEIQRTSGGKLRAMVNECDDPEVRDAIAAGWNRANAEHGADDFISPDAQVTREVG
jgi:hypothetical protein